MKFLAPRMLAVLVLAALGWIVLAGATTKAPSQPDKLVILSTSDVKGEFKPCG
ncbi:MAG TPA: hypothetical protein VJY35_14390 [Candidatus Eisenbacteria bacterium]|nr:hypothetical protein [Candidatus Eisenbacteria bacterium]